MVSIAAFQLGLGGAWPSLSPHRTLSPSRWPWCFLLHPSPRSGLLRCPLKRIPRGMSPVLRTVVPEGKPEAQWQSWGAEEYTHGCYGNRGSQDGRKRKGGPAQELPWQPRSWRPALKTKTTHSPLALKYPGLLREPNRMAHVLLVAQLIPQTL